MTPIYVEGLSEVIDRLTAIKEIFDDLNPLLELISSRVIGHFNMSNTPVLTGWFLSNIVLLHSDQTSVTVGEDLGSVVYAARVIFGITNSGGPFSELGHLMFERELEPVEELVYEEAEDYILNKILEA